MGNTIIPSNEMGLTQVPTFRRDFKQQSLRLRRPKWSLCLKQNTLIVILFSGAFCGYEWVKWAVSWLLVY